MSHIFLSRVAVAAAGVAVTLAFAASPADAGSSKTSAKTKSSSKVKLPGLAPENSPVAGDPGDGESFNPYRCMFEPGFTYYKSAGTKYIRIGWATLEEVQDKRFLEIQSGDVFELRKSNGSGGYDVLPTSNTWAMGDASGWSVPTFIPATDNSPDMWAASTWLPLGYLASGDYYFDLTATINVGTYGSFDIGGTPPGPWVTVTNCHIRVN